MQQVLLVYCVTLYASAFLALGLILLVSARFRHKAGFGWLLGLLGAVAVHSLGAAVEAGVRTQSAKILWSQLEYLGAAPACFCLFGFVAAYLGLKISRWLWRMLWLGPILTLVLVWTNSWHHLIWTGFSWSPGGANVLVYHHGPGFFAFIAYSQFVGLAAVWLAWAARRQSKGIHRPQLGLLCAGALLPLITTLFYVLHWAPIPGLDMCELGYLAGGALLAASLNDYGLMDLVPAARGALVEGMPDGVLVFDAALRLLDINRAAENMIGRSGSKAIGQEADDLLKSCAPLQKLLSGEAGGQAEIHDPSGRVLEARAMPIYEKHRQVAGMLVVLRDVTAVQAAMAEREKLILELQQALAQVKTLSGMLPICAGCKRIRDDAGYWNQIEVYIAQHSKATFTHGLCPDCTRKYFPGVPTPGKDQPPSAPKSSNPSS